MGINLRIKYAIFIRKNKFLFKTKTWTYLFLFKAPLKKKRKNISLEYTSEYFTNSVNFIDFYVCFSFFDIYYAFFYDFYKYKFSGYQWKKAFFIANFKILREILNQKAHEV